MSIYELGILGDVSDAQRKALAETIGRMVGDFGLSVGAELLLHDGTTVGTRDKHAAFAAAYFGGPHAVDLEAARALARSSVPIIPTVGPSGDFGRDVPEFLQASNGLRRRADDPGLEELAAALLECVGLLGRQRRVFVSYRRIESRAAAMQLHDVLSARGFDVFLDTHDIRPSEPFQEALWHRLCDSDMMVMLDTSTYFKSKWTQQEFGRAQAKGLHFLRVVWPDHTPSRHTDLAQTLFLSKAELLGPDGPVVDAVADRIALEVERLRSRSIASRYMAITGQFRAQMQAIGASIDGIGAHRAVSVRLGDGRRLRAFPVVGVPTAEVLFDVDNKASRSPSEGMPVLVYDSIGIREGWAQYLAWLDTHITVVRSLKVHSAGWDLSAWES